MAAVVNSQNIINNINIEKETNNHRTTDSNKLCTSSLKYNGSIIYQLKMKINGKKETKMVKKENILFLKLKFP